MLNMLLSNDARPEALRTSFHDHEESASMTQEVTVKEATTTKQNETIRLDIPVVTQSYCLFLKRQPLIVAFPSQQKEKSSSLLPPAFEIGLQS